MIFAQKSFLLLLIFIPLAAALLFFFVKKRKKDLFLLMGENDIKTLSNVNLKAYDIKNIFLILGFIFLIMALARPQYGQKDSRIEKRSSEIIIALDVSKSMFAQDIKPNRMLRAKMLISAVCDECSGDKIGVIAFSGTAMWQCPMTYDGEAVKMFLQNADSNSLPFGGTQFAAPINLAVKSREGQFSSSSAMLLITDGEDHDEKTDEAIEAAKKANLRILSVGIGTYQGAPVPIKNEEGTLLGYVSDSSGKTVVSKLNSELLKKISKETGGHYFEMSDNKDISQSIINEIKRLDKNSSGTQRENAKNEAFWIFLLLALIFFTAELIYPAAKKNEN